VKQGKPALLKLRRGEEGWYREIHSTTRVLDKAFSSLWQIFIFAREMRKLFLFRRTAEIVFSSRSLTT